MIRKWFVDSDRHKVTLSAGVLDHDVLVVFDNDDSPDDQTMAVLWRAKGQSVTAGEAVEANAEQHSDAVPATHSPPPVLDLGGDGPGGGTGGSADIADAFAGEWADGPYPKNTMVTRSKSLYVATRDALAGDDPAFVGAPVDVGGVGPDTPTGPGVGGAWTGSIGNTYVRFDTSAPCKVSHIKMWSAPGSTIPGPVTAGIYSADRSTKLVQGVSTLTEVAGALVIAMEDAVDLPAGSYNFWYTNGHHVAIAQRVNLTIDGVVSAIADSNAMYTDDYGLMGGNINPFRLWSPPATDSAWVRLVKGV